MAVLTKPSPPTAGDFWGALSSTVVALPAAIAFGVLIFSPLGPGYASVGASVGAIGTVALGLIAPVLGRNGGLVTAPCAPAAAVLSGLAAAQAETHGGSPAYVVATMAVVALFAGLLQLLYGALKVGRIIKFIPFQVVTGYLSGIALIIATGQLPKLLGFGDRVKLVEGLLTPSLWRWQGIAVGAATIVAILVAPKLTRQVPGAVLGLATGVGSFFALGALQPELLSPSANPLLVGPLAGGPIADAVSDRLGALSLFHLGDFWHLLATAGTLSVLLSIDTLKTAVVLDAMTRARSDSNRELVAQGAANAVAALVGGMPGAGTMGATLVNVTSGGRTPWSGFGVGVLALLSFLVLGRAMAWIPVAALAGILIVVAVRMFDWRMLALLAHRETRLDFFVIVAVVVVAQGVGLLQAALLGVGLAILLFMRDQVRGSAILRQQDLRDIASKRRRLPQARDLLDEKGEAGLLVQLQGDLFFGTTDRLFCELAADLDKRRYLLFDLRRVQSMDYTAAHLFELMRTRLESQGGRMLLSGMPSAAGSRGEIERYLSKLGLVHGESGLRVFEHRNAALEWMEDRILEEAGIAEPAEAGEVELTKIELFRELDAHALADISIICEPMTLAPGTRLFSRGDQGDAIYLIGKGILDIFLPLPGGKRHHLATVGSGDYVGELAFLDKGTRSADAEARGTVQLWALARASFNDFAREHPAVASMIFARLALLVTRRLRTADAELRVLEER